MANMGDKMAFYKSRIRQNLYEMGWMERMKIFTRNCGGKRN